MIVFNSLGSNYKFNFAWRHFVGKGSQQDYQKLISNLSKRYKGEAFLFYKGREALVQALLAAELSEGSEVAINGFTCYAVDEAVAKAGFKSVYLDIDKDTLNFTADTLQKAINSNPQIKAVIVQNTLGYACDISAIEKICKQNKLILIEDLAHSIGLKYADGREAGTVGDMVMLSFGRDKVIDVVGGGALIVRKNVPQKWLDNLKQKRHAPNKQQMFIDRMYPLNTWVIRATYGIGIGKLKQIFMRKLGLLPRATDGAFDGYTDLPASFCKEINSLYSELDKSLRRRAKIADVYRENLSKAQISKVAHSNNGAVELRFPVSVSGRNELFAALKQDGINISDVWYDSPIAPPRFMSKTSYNGECANSEELTKQLINLPTHANISESAAKKIAERISSFV